MTSGQYKQGGSLHRRKVRLWQALCCASAFVGGAAEAQEALDHVLSSLREFNMANVRQYQEALAVVLIRRSPKELLRRLLSELDAYEHRNEGLASYVLIAAEVCRLIFPAATIAGRPGPSSRPFPAGCTCACA